MPFTVLIADDEQLERDALRAVIEGTSDGVWRILSAATGTEAVTLVGRHRIDLAFLDIAMPGRSGLEVAEMIRERDDTAAIVFVTAFDSFEYARTALRLRAEDYLVKPVEDDAVERIVRRVYDRRTREVRRSAARGARGSTDSGATQRPGEHAEGDGRERLSELIRFLELELLDDLIAGDGDDDDLISAFGLLGISRIQGIGVVVKPALEEYPFRLETAGQRRTVVQRMLRAVSLAFGGEDRTVLSRAHDDIGYLVVLTADTDDPGDLEVLLEPDSLARISDTAAQAVSISVRLSATAPFRTAAELSFRIREARRRLFNSDETCSPLRQELHPEAAAEQRILKALIDADESAARRGGEELWDLLASDEFLQEAESGAVGPGPTDQVVRDKANRTLSFLAHSLRARGLAVPTDRELLLDDASGDRRVLRAEFVRRISTLRDVSEGVPDDGIVRRVREFLRDRYRDEIGLTDVAGYLGLSESHCSRAISRRFGVSFSHLLREYRLQIARRLLAEEERTIQEVAEGAGFRDANYFSRVFHREHGMSPRGYRRTLV
ncbi:MAG: response regulator transcription factor [Alkalispirochaeta sp.]